MVTTNSECCTNYKISAGQTKDAKKPDYWGGSVRAMFPTENNRQFERDTGVVIMSDGHGMLRGLEQHCQKPDNHIYIV